MNRVFESKEAEDKTQKDFVINTFKEMYLKYKDTFKDDGLSDIQLANKFEDNIMPGFFDFAILFLITLLTVSFLDNVASKRDFLISRKYP